MKNQYALIHKGKLSKVTSSCALLQGSEYRCHLFMLPCNNQSRPKSSQFEIKVSI